jgi:hypothetical protein
MSWTVSAMKQEESWEWLGQVQTNKGVFSFHLFWFGFVFHMEIWYDQSCDTLNMAKAADKFQSNGRLLWASWNWDMLPICSKFVT